MEHDETEKAFLNLKQSLNIGYQTELEFKGNLLNNHSISLIRDSQNIILNHKDLIHSVESPLDFLDLKTTSEIRRAF